MKFARKYEKYSVPAPPPIRACNNSACPPIPRYSALSSPALDLAQLLLLQLPLLHWTLLNLLKRIQLCQPHNMGQTVGNPGAWPMGNANQGRNRLGGGSNKAHTQVFRPAVKYSRTQGEYQATFWRLIYSDQVVMCYCYFCCWDPVSVLFWFQLRGILRKDIHDNMILFMNMSFSETLLCEFYFTINQWFFWNNWVVSTKRNWYVYITILFLCIICITAIVLWQILALRICLNVVTILAASDGF